MLIFYTACSSMHNGQSMFLISTQTSGNFRTLTIYMSEEDGCDGTVVVKKLPWCSESKESINVYT